MEDIVNIDKGSSHGALNKKFDGITYDGEYSDWDDYPHSLIEYSTQGG